MEKHWDLGFGTAGTLGTITLAQFNTLIAAGCGLLTFAVLALRLAREWRHRNEPPKK